MKVSILVIAIMSLMSVTALANSVQCSDLQLEGSKKINIEFKERHSGRTAEDGSDLLEGDELISVVLPVGANQDLTWSEANEVNNKSFKILKSKIVGEIIHLTGNREYKLEAILEIPNDIAIKYNNSQTQADITCTEFIVCSGMDC